MPTVNLNLKVLEKLIGKKLSLELLKDRISMLGTDLDKIEGNEVVVEVFPNRPDMLSEQGFARALSSFIGVKTGLKKYCVKKPLKDYQVIINDSVKKVRPYTACAIVKNLTFNDEKIREIIQIQEKLHVSLGRNRKKLAIGIYPLEQIKTPITYTAKKPNEIRFQPLESPREMTGLQILSQHPAGRDYGHLLEGKAVFPIFIDSKNEILSMPPIINSHKTGKINENTKEVFIECSGFDFKSLNQCLNIIVTALADMGGEIYQMELLYKKKKIITPNLNPVEWKLDLNYVNRLIGLKLSEKEIKILLEKMGLGYENKKVLVPAYRTDILHQIDIAEDIAIAYGYDNFEPEIPNVSTIGKENSFEVFKRKIANILVGTGILETISYHLTSINEHNEKMCFKSEVIELENPSTSEYSVLRSWITPSLMQILSRNTNKEYPQNIFEIGTVFKPNTKEETNVEENSRLGVALCGPDVNFTTIKQILDILFSALDMTCAIEETKHPSFINGRVGRVFVGKKAVAYIGEISPEVLEQFNIEMPVSCFELNLTNLIQVINNK
ncbi:MAG: phenylalanine--tRNA ligase subunit beta [Nanoarchaeota archaeon]|nr:phenylalanine--tRNA ligase subunit beta [Nanoarchaeota archaeon]MBU1030535.1 phenylalanine--tRNA ligase subunit beta [Nanoarchaeota archaeon]MBU1849487.1 phenylalanine--tRNA ligase subunit beta [Nanoarchaeota archaeon]